MDFASEALFQGIVLQPAGRGILLWRKPAYGRITRNAWITVLRGTTLLFVETKFSYYSGVYLMPPTELLVVC